MNDNRLDLPADNLFRFYTRETVAISNAPALPLILRTAWEIQADRLARKAANT